MIRCGIRLCSARTSTIVGGRRGAAVSGCRSQPFACSRPAVRRALLGRWHDGRRLRVDEEVPAEGEERWRSAAGGWQWRAGFPWRDPVERNAHLDRGSGRPADAQRSLQGSPALLGRSCGDEKPQRLRSGGADNGGERHDGMGRHQGHDGEHTWPLPDCHRRRRHSGYTISQRARKRIEEIFGWVRTTGGLQKTLHRCTALVNRTLTLAVAACKVVRIPKLTTATG